MVSLPDSTHEGLFPGYKHVEEFGPDEEYEEEVEESYVTMDLGNVDPALITSSSTYRLIGLDTGTPFLQLSGTVMQGEYKNLLGTELLFKGSSEEETERQGIKYLANTNRRILFNEVELKRKNVTSARPKDGELRHVPSEAVAGAKEIGKEETDIATSSEPGDVQVSLGSTRRGTDMNSAAATPSAFTDKEKVS